MKTEILREAFKSSKTLIHCVTLYKYQFHDKITKNLRVALRNQGNVCFGNETYCKKVVTRRLGIENSMVEKS